MSSLNFNVDGQRLSIASHYYVVADSMDYIEADFTYVGTEWTEADTIWCHIRQGTTVHTVPVIDGHITQDAHINLTEGNWCFSLTGNTGISRVTTNPVQVTVRISGVIDSEPLPMPPSVGEQVYMIAEEALETANGALTEAKEYTDVVKDRVETIITTPVEGVSAQEIIDARQGNLSLGANLTSVKSQLAENASQIADIAVNVKSAGAKGDGITDDTAAIKAAIELAGVNGTLIFPPHKTYLVSAKLYAKAGQTWYGYGACVKRINEIKTTTTDNITTSTNPTTINVASASAFRVGMEVTITTGRNNTLGCYISHRISAINGNQITVVGNFTKAFPTGGTVVTNLGLISVLGGNNNVKIYGLELDGNRANNDTYLNWQSQAAIVSGSNSGILKDLYIHDSQADGIMFGGIGTVLDSCTILSSGANAIHISGATGVKIVNNYCKDATLSITGTDNATGADHSEGVITFSSYIVDTIIANNHLENGRTCIGGIGSSDNSDITITGNTMRGATYNAIEIITGEAAAPYLKNIVITNNRFYDCAPVGLTNNQSGGLAYESGNRNVIFSNNLLQNTRLSCTRLKHAIIEGNIIDISGDTTTTAISVNYCKSLQFYNNHIIGGRYGLYLTSVVASGIELNSSDIIINGNEFRNQTDVSLLTHSVMGTRYKNIIVSNNTILIESGALVGYVGIYAGSGILATDNCLNIAGGGYGIVCAGDSPSTPYGYQGAIVKGNVIRTDGGVPSVRIGGGTANNIVTGNYVVQAISNLQPADNTVETNYTIL